MKLTPFAGCFTTDLQQEEKNLDDQAASSGGTGGNAGRWPDTFTENTLRRQRNKFQLCMHQHQAQGMSALKATGLAAVKSLVPIPLARILLAKSIEDKKRAEALEQVYISYGARNALRMRVAPDPYDTSDHALELYLDTLNGSENHGLQEGRTRLSDSNGK